jgi:hypothetical protein
MTPRVKLLGFNHTPAIPNQIGIATVLLLDEVIARFKTVNKKDGSGYFIAPCSIKSHEDGKEIYLDAIAFERNSFKDEVYNLIRSHLSKSMAPPQNTPKSGFDDDMFGNQPPPF